MANRYAIAMADLDEVEQYLPGNYSVVATTDAADGSNVCLIVGEDVAGWTLDDYVIPRLGSGLIFAKETTPENLAKDLGREA